MGKAVARADDAASCVRDVRAAYVRACAVSGYVCDVQDAVEEGKKAEDVNVGAEDGDLTHPLVIREPHSGARSMARCPASGRASSRSSSGCCSSA